MFYDAWQECRRGLKIIENEKVISGPSYDFARHFQCGLVPRDVPCELLRKEFEGRKYVTKRYSRYCI